MRATYRELVKVWHPDRFINDATLRAKADRRLQEINRAYAVLQDRAEIVDLTPEALRHPDVAPPPSGPQSTAARWSLATLVTIGPLIGAPVGVMIVILVRADVPTEPAEGTDLSVLRPLSGTDLLATPLTGGGLLTVLNADRRDTVLVFVDAGLQRRAVYVRAGERLQMLDVAPGAFRIWVASGRQWSRDHFVADQVFQELNAPLTFTEDRSAMRTITIGAPGTTNVTPLRASSPFVLDPGR